MNIFKSIIVFFIGLNCFSQQWTREWIISSKDSLVHAKHYWNDATEQLDSLNLEINGKILKFPNNAKYKQKADLLINYQDSITIPFDFQIPIITSVKNLSHSIAVVTGYNEGISKMFTHYSHIVLIDKKRLKIICWVVTNAPRGFRNPLFVIDEKRKQIMIPKERNYINENKIYVLNFKKKKYKEIYIKKSIRLMGDGKFVNQKEYSSVFNVSY